MSFARSGPLKGILAQIRPQPARETGGPTPGWAQRRVSGFPQGAHAEPCPPDRYSELRRAGAWRRRPTMGRRYTLHRVVGQPNFTIGRDLGWLPGMLEDASTGESCLAARRPYEPPGFSTYEDGCLRELEKPAAMEGTGETDSVAEGPDSNHRVPLFRKGLSAVAEGDAGPMSWMGPLSTGRLARRRWSATGPLSTAVSFSAGPIDAMGRAAEEMATSSLHLTMECRDAPAERPEQIPRRPGPK